jgi:predicted RNase H-like nuclease/cytidine deaminase
MTSTFIGIDLAWKSTRNPTGAAILTGDRSGARLEALATMAPEISVADFILRHATDDTVVAIDGPLVIVNETGQRPCEIDVSKRYSARDAGCYPSNLQLLPDASSVLLAGELLAQGFSHVDRASAEAHGRVMAEVYPHAGMVALWDLPKTIKYKRGTAAAKRSGLHELKTRLTSLYQAEPRLLRTAVIKELLDLKLDGPDKIELKAHEDRLDALFCAYLAYYFWYWGWERNELFGDIETGYILNPKLHTGFISGTAVPPVNHAQDAHATRGTGVPPVNVTQDARSSGTSLPPMNHAQDAHATSYADLIAQAHALARPLQPSADCSAASVASVIVSRSGKAYTGVCLDFSCSLGFCAEHAAIAEMLKAHDSEIALVVAVDEHGNVLAPCGRCREMMWQLNPLNRDALVILAPDQALPLHELLPYR